MAKSVNLLKKALENEKVLITNYKEALDSMVHEESKRVVESIIESNKKHIIEIQKIIENSKKCPAVTK